MRFLLAGLVCLLIGVSITEYVRRHPADQVTSTRTDVEADAAPTAAKKQWPAAVASLLELSPAGAETAGPVATLSPLLTVPDLAPVAGFAPLTGGAFTAHHLTGGFGASVFVLETKGTSGLVRVASGEAAKVIVAREGRIEALAVDGSMAYFAADGVVMSVPARGGEAPQVRARFKRAVVTSLAANGDTLVLTVMPRDADPQSSDAVGAVVRLDGNNELHLIAPDVVRPRAAQTDGKDAWWLAGQPGALWRGALDGAFTSQLHDGAEAPLVLDGDGLYFRAPLGTGPELKRIGRAGGALSSVIAADVAQVSVSSGFVRLTTQGAGAALLELVGGEASKVMVLPGEGRGVSVAGTTVFLATQASDGTTVVWAK